MFETNGRPPCGGIAIGDMIVDVGALDCTGLLAAEATEVARAGSAPVLNRVMAMPPARLSAFRHQVADLLDAEKSHGQKRKKMSDVLVPMRNARMRLPAKIGGFTDFFTSLEHVTRVSAVVRPGAPLPPAFKQLPMAYNGRASSVVPSDEEITRPHGQIAQGDKVTFAPTRALDFELEMGIFIGAGNRLGQPIKLSEASGHLFGLCLLNDWSSRDIQRFESFPLGPFQGKSFCTTVAPWIVTAEALTPFRRAARTREHDDPPLQSYLSDNSDRQWGAFDIEVTATLSTREMRSSGAPAHVLTRSNLNRLYWTCAQMIAHHTSNGCNLQPGDLLGTGTISGPDEESRACLLEITGGTKPLSLPNGETRTWIEDGDEIIFTARTTREGFVPIGFGECRARIAPSYGASR